MRQSASAKSAQSMTFRMIWQATSVVMRAPGRKHGPYHSYTAQLKMGTRIGLISDLHYRNVVPGTSKNVRRETRRAGELLRRCLDELVRMQVDALVCAGDCVDDESQPGVLEDVA